MAQSSRSPSIRGLTADASQLPALAARSLRLLAALIDALLAGVLVFLTVAGALVGGAGTITALAGAKDQLLTKVGGAGFGVMGTVVAVIAGTALLVLTLYQWYLLSTQGQTIGKRACGLRIVDATTGKPAGFVQALLLRALLPMAIVAAATALLGWLLPPIGGLLSLFDLVPLFGPERRCVHDYLAGTQVRWVEAKSEQRMQLALLGLGVLAVGGVGTAAVLNPKVLEAIRPKPTPPLTAVAPPAPTPAPAPAPEPAPVVPAPPAPVAPAPVAPAPVAPAPALTPGIYSWVDGDGTTSFTNDPSSIPEKYKASIKKLGE